MLIRRIRTGSADQRQRGAGANLQRLRDNEIIRRLQVPLLQFAESNAKGSEQIEY